MRRSLALFATAATALAALVIPTAASAADLGGTPMQDRVDQVIDEHGGVQTDWNEVSWDDDEIVLTLAPDLRSDADGASSATAAAAKENCASGKYCAYASAFYGGNKLTFSACPATQTSFSALGGSPRSIMNDRSSGTVRAYGGSTLKTTLPAGKGTSNISGVTKITCS